MAHLVGSFAALGEGACRLRAITRRYVKSLRRLGVLEGDCERMGTPVITLCTGTRGGGTRRRRW
jgi:hypothetical protein